MNTTNISSGVSEALLIAPFQLNISLGIFIFITGNISTFGNFMVFSSRTFRSRACSVYLLAESICTFVYFNFVLTTRMIQKGYQIPIINRYDVICKIRQFLSEYTHQVAFSLFALATIDRLLSTHRSVGTYKYIYVVKSNTAVSVDFIRRFYKRCPDVFLYFYVFNYNMRLSYRLY
jgi:hypothetical protein